MLSITRATEDEAPSTVSPTFVSVRGKSFTKIVVVAMLIFQVQCLGFALHVHYNYRSSVITELLHP